MKERGSELKTYISALEYHSIHIIKILEECLSDALFVGHSSEKCEKLPRRK